MRKGATAAAALPELQVVTRDPAAERAALQRLAAWSYQYSDQVCIPGDRNGLFLEAGASERLFGRTEHLGKRLEQELGNNLVDEIRRSSIAGINLKMLASLSNDSYNETPL